MIENNYYSIAINDYEYLNFNRNSKFYNQMASQCQQICEKFLKAILITQVAEDRLLRSHSLVDIYKAIRNEISLSERCYLALSRVTDLYFNARYPGSDFVVVDEEDMELCFFVVDEVYKVVTEWWSRVNNETSESPLEEALKQLEGKLQFSEGL